jgi:hypothetical protein
MALSRTLWTVSATLAVAAAGLTGCVSAHPVGPTGSPSTTPTVSGISVTDFATRSGPWPATQELLETAVDRLTDRCLSEQGFDPATTVPPTYPVPEDEAAVIDLPARRTKGYGLRADRAAPTGKAQNGGGTDPYFDRLTPPDRQRYRAALFGPANLGVRIEIGGIMSVVLPAQGCLATSRRAIAGDLAVWGRLTYLPQALDRRLSRQALTAPGYLAGMANWRACMAGRGHPYRTPEEARTELKAEQRVGDDPGWRRREIAVAVADGECAAQVHLPRAELTARRDLAAALPEAERADLAELLTRRTAAVSRAASVVTGASGQPGRGQG